MDVEFRAAELEDADMLAGLMREYYAYDEHEYDDAKVRRTLADFLKDHTWGYAWLIEAGGQTIGYMVMCFGYSLEFGGRDGFLDEIYLREGYRGQGIGGQAIEHMIDTCRAEGIRALHLEVMPGNTQVKAFYERIGFENRGSTLMSRYVS